MLPRNKYYRHWPAGLAMLLVAACGNLEERSGAGMIAAQVSVPGPSPKSAPQPRAVDPTLITAIRGTVTGADFSPVTQTYSYAAATPPCALNPCSTSNIPVGANRTLTVDALDASGVVLLSGQKTGLAVNEGAVTDAGKVVLLPPLGPNDLRITLTWGAQPPDLDLHVRTPAGVEVFYGNQTAGGTSLDVDVTSGNGPEVVTITQAETGLYKASVKNFSGHAATPLSDSGARMVVSTLANPALYSVSVPPGSSATNDVWYVYDCDAPAKTCTTINKFQPTPP